MEGSPRKNKERPEKGYKDASLQKKEDENDYSQQGIICGELPLPINGDLLKEILHRSVGALKFLNKYKQPRAGSGVLISRDTILTAAHNIYDRDEDCKCENEDFKFYIGADGEAKDSYEIEEKCWRFPKEYKTCLKNRLQFDFAIMKLKKPIQFNEYMPLSLACKECLMKDNKKIMLEIYGFPASYKDNYQPLNPQDKYKKAIKLNQYGIADKNRIFDINASQLKICYGISTLPGQSGCPVVVDNNIIAVHVGDSSKFNVGRIVDASFMTSIWKWREELNAAPFSLKDEKVCLHVQQTLEKMRYSGNRGLAEIGSEWQQHEAICERPVQQEECSASYPLPKSTLTPKLDACQNDQLEDHRRNRNMKREQLPQPPNCSLGSSQKAFSI